MLVRTACHTVSYFLPIVRNCRSRDLFLDSFSEQIVSFLDSKPLEIIPSVVYVLKPFLSSSSVISVLSIKEKKSKNQRKSGDLLFTRRGTDASRLAQQEENRRSDTFISDVFGDHYTVRHRYQAASRDSKVENQTPRRWRIRLVQKIPKLYSRIFAPLLVTP